MTKVVVEYIYNVRRLSVGRCKRCGRDKAWDIENSYSGFQMSVNTSLERECVIISELGVAVMY